MKARIPDRMAWVRFYWFRGNSCKPGTYDILRKDLHSDEYRPTDEVMLDHETMINRVNQLNLAANDNPYSGG
jgi:hypothetical protein